MEWIEFTVSAVLIVLAGIRLTDYADQLSDHLNFAKAWIGIVLLGLVTSLPEAITTVAAVINLRAYDLAVGNIFGSNIFNPLLIVVMDFMRQQGTIATALKPNISHNRSAQFSICLALFVIFDIFAGRMFPSAGQISVMMVAVGVGYLWAMKYLGSLGVDESMPTHDISRLKDHKNSLSAIWINIFASAAVVILAALWLTKTADIISIKTGLGQTFVGSILLALVTSLPEIVVSVSAFRMGQIDLAVGNIFGSNMTNIFIIFVCSLLKEGDPMLWNVSPTHLLTGIIGIMMTLLALRSINIKKEPVYGRLGQNSVMMLALFILGTLMLYQLR